MSFGHRFAIAFFSVSVLMSLVNTTCDPEGGEPVPCLLNRAPVAEAGSAVSGRQGDVLMLSGARSMDPDGDALSYTWTEISGPVGGKLMNSNRAEAMFSAYVAGTYVMGLAVSDGCAIASDTVEVTVAGGRDVEIVPPVNSLASQNPLTISSTWTGASDKVFGELFWTLPTNDRISETVDYREAIDGSSAISEPAVRAVDGVHEIMFKSWGPALALADTEFRVEYLNYVFEASRSQMVASTRHTIQLLVQDGCVTELGNSWRKEDGGAVSRPQRCREQRMVHVASTWVDATSPVFGEFQWTLPTGEAVRETVDYREAFAGSSALPASIDLVEDGVHEIRFTLWGDTLALVDVDFDIEFMNYCFRASQLAMRGQTQQTIKLDVRSGFVTELANSWRSSGNP